MQTAPSIFYEDTVRHVTLASHKQAVAWQQRKPTGHPPGAGIWQPQSRPALATPD